MIFFLIWHTVKNNWARRYFEYLRKRDSSASRLQLIHIRRKGLSLEWIFKTKHRKTHFRFVYQRIWNIFNRWAAPANSGTGMLTMTSSLTFCVLFYSIFVYMNRVSAFIFCQLYQLPFIYFLTYYISYYSIIQKRVHFNLIMLNKVVLRIWDY